MHLNHIVCSTHDHDCSGDINPRLECQQAPPHGGLNAQSLDYLLLLGSVSQRVLIYYLLLEAVARSDRNQRGKDSTAGLGGLDKDCRHVPCTGCQDVTCLQWCVSILILVVAAGQLSAANVESNSSTIILYGQRQTQQHTSGRAHMPLVKQQRS